MPKKYQGIEARRYPRISWNFIVKFRLKTSQDSKWFISNITNISQGGCFFYSPVPYEIGQTLEVEIQFPRLTQPMHFLGEVRRKVDEENALNSRYGIAVMFLEMEEEKRKEFLESIDFFLKKR
ncbi:MAG: PilZ domain-containing protein [Candidatus Omnitrophica bacterium]|nr:PilZ domain-containing protein [Candidatus Omnitrophota bacterium]